VTLRVELAPRAERDLLEIRTYLEREASAQIATAMADRILQRISSLAEQPLIGEQRFGAGRRALVEQPYLIIYRCGEDWVRILRIVHGARDVPKLLRR
jgi:toxin ParE1/3/4